MKLQNVPIKDLIEGHEALLRIAREEKSGDHKTAYRLGKMQSKVMGLIGEGSPYEFARKSLLRQKTIVARAKQPNGSEGEESRRFASTADREAYEEEVMAMQTKEVQIPTGFLKPAEATAHLKLDKPISAAEMAVMWWLFDKAAIEAMEAEWDAEA